MAREPLIFNIGEAKTQLSKLVHRAELGERIVIARGNEPVAELMPITSAVRQPGRLLSVMSPDAAKAFVEALNHPLSADELAAAEGRDKVLLHSPVAAEAGSGT